MTKEEILGNMSEQVIELEKKFSFELLDSGKMNDLKAIVNNWSNEWEKLNTQPTEMKEDK